jgi:hypothetical protein
MRFARRQIHLCWTFWVVKLSGVVGRYLGICGRYCFNLHLIFGVDFQPWRWILTSFFETLVSTNKSTRRYGLDHGSPTFFHHAPLYQCWTTGRSGFDPRRGQRIFPLSSVSRPALGPTQPSVQWVPGVKRGRDVTLTTLPHLVPR